MKALLIDHDDSFTQNLKHWLKPLAQEIQVINHSQISTFFQHGSFDLFVLSPGPKSPLDYPDTLKLLAELPQDKAVFGVCLGLQMMAVSCGLSVSTYSPPKHGKTSKLKIRHPDLQNFENLAVARYHSIKVVSVASDASTSSGLQLLAVAEDDNQPMWFSHSSKKWMGVQFHPESFLTEAPELHLQFLKSWFGK